MNWQTNSHFQRNYTWDSELYFYEPTNVMIMYKV